MKVLLPLMIFTFIVSCSRDEMNNSKLETVLVFEGKKVTQCKNTGITLFDSSMKLVAAGLDVLGSSCSVMTGVSFASICGGRDCKYSHTQNS